MSFDGCNDGGGAIHRSRRQVCQSFTCASPWLILRRWITGDKSNGSRNWGNEKRNLNLKRKLGISNGFRNSLQSSSSPTDFSEISKEASFNLGVGLGLIYLAAASRNEVNKMVELHKEIEILLGNLRTEFHNLQEKFKPYCVPSNSNPTNSESVCTDQQNDSGLYVSSSSRDVRRVEIGIVSDRCRVEKCFGKDRIEAEMEAEEIYLKYSKHRHSEVEASVPRWSINSCFEEHSTDHHQHKEVSDEYYSVPARELERRLHELLEARQQERIDELETTLERARQQVQDKEREVSWWKDTTRLIARRLPPIPNSAVQIKHGYELEIDVRELSRSMVINSLFETKREDVGRGL